MYVRTTQLTCIFGDKTPAMECSSDSEDDMTADDHVQSDQSASKSNSGNN